MSIRHLILAEGMLQTIFSYSSKYAHSVPSPLDPFVFSFNSLEDYEDLYSAFDMSEVET